MRIRSNSKKYTNSIVSSFNKPKNQSMMDNYYNTKSTWRDSNAAGSVNATFYTELSAAKEILNSEKQHFKGQNKKRGKMDPELNIKDTEIRAMF